MLRNRKILHTVYIFIFSSLLIHLSLYGGLEFLSQLSPQTVSLKKTPVEVLIVEAPPIKETTKQIIEQDQKRVNDEVPQDSKYLSRHNQKIVEQTKAAASGKFTNSALPGQRVQGDPNAQKQDKSTTKQLGNLPSLKKLKPTFSLSPKTNKQHFTQAGQESQSPDHLKDVKTGIQTLLSTREFVYYAYYQRIRSKIRQHWEPNIREKVKKVFQSGRSIASSRDRTTQVIIILNPQGSLINVQVLGESGIKDLDDAAIEAFKAAEPFPNPPKGIVEGDGTIKIRWDFVLEAQYIPESEKQLARSEK